MSQMSLADRLALLANDAPEFDGSARRLNAADPVNSILDEIDNSLMPAVLVFANGGKELRLHAAGRMLNQIAGYSEPHPASDTIIATSLDPENAEQLAAIARIFSSFSEGCEHLSCTSTVVDEFGGSVTNRVSVAVLRQALGAQAARDERTPYDRFHAMIDHSISAYLLIEDGAEGVSFGDNVTISMLRVAAKTQLDAFEAKLKAAGGEIPRFSLNLFSGVLDAKETMCVAKFGATYFLFSIKSEVTFDVMLAFEQSIS